MIVVVGSPYVDLLVFCRHAETHTDTKFVASIEILNSGWIFVYAQCPAAPNVYFLRFGYSDAIIAAMHFLQFLWQVEVLCVGKVPLVSQAQLEVRVQSTSIDSFYSNKDRVFGSCGYVLTRVDVELLWSEVGFFRMQSQLAAVVVAPPVDLILVVYFIVYAIGSDTGELLNNSSLNGKTVVHSCADSSRPSHYLFEAITVLSHALAGGAHLPAAR